MRSGIELKNERRLTAGRVHHRWPAWSRDGELMTFVAGDGNQAAWVIADRRGRVVRVLEGPADEGASFGPDDALAFTRRLGFTCEIWMTPSPSSPAVRLLGGDGQLYRDPAWSPDGKTLAFATAGEPGARTHIMLLDIDSGSRRAITSNVQRADARPAFAPQGDTLFFDGTSNDETAVYSVDLTRDGAEPRRLTDPAVMAQRPAPCGPDLVIVQQRARNKEDVCEIAAVDRRDGSVHRVAMETRGRDARDPSCVRIEGGKLRIAWVALIDAVRGEPRRYDVVVARVLRSGLRGGAA